MSLAIREAKAAPSVRPAVRPTYLYPFSALKAPGEFFRFPAGVPRYAAAQAAYRQNKLEAGKGDAAKRYATRVIAGEILCFRTQ